MIKYIYIVLILLSCSQNSNKEINYDFQIDTQESPVVEEVENLINPKAQYYLDLMKSKNYSISMNGPCENALDDNTLDRLECKILSKDLNKNKAIISFKFKAACCQEFMGNYMIKNNILTFNMEQVNDVVCSCICWYHYKLKINDIESKINNIKFNFINR